MDISFKEAVVEPIAEIIALFHGKVAEPGILYSTDVVADSFKWLKYVVNFFGDKLVRGFNTIVPSGIEGIIGKFSGR